MENEIKVGDWIRDREGHITKIIQTLLLFKDVELYLGEDGYQYSDNAIVKHSSNLIDIIEERRLCKWIHSKKNLFRWRNALYKIRRTDNKK